MTLKQTTIQFLNRTINANPNLTAAFRILRLGWYSLPDYLTDMFGFAFRLVCITLAGLVFRAFFNMLTGEDGMQMGITEATLYQLLLTIVSGAGLMAALFGGFRYDYRSKALLIRNLVEYLLQRPGASPLPRIREYMKTDVDGDVSSGDITNGDNTPAQKHQSSGQVISTLRDDTIAISEVMVTYLDFIAMGTAATISLVIMWQTSPFVTLGTFAPLALVIYVAKRLSNLAKQYRQLSREATSEVTGLISDMFNNTQAIKVAHAEDRIIDRFVQLGEQRREFMVKDRLITQIVLAMGDSSGAIGTGLILLFAAQSMYQGNFTIGDFALFGYYIWPVTVFMRTIGNVITKTKQISVSFQRMQTLLEADEALALGNIDTREATAFNPIYLDGNRPLIPYQPKADDHTLYLLSVKHLTYQYDSVDEDSGKSAGITDIALNLPKESFTVITGRIGSGKSTLIKALLGLLPMQAGEISWNGQHVNDPANFFVPPRCAYTGQTPRLFSDTLRDNILMGLPFDDNTVRIAIHQAVFTQDVAEMKDGLDTMVGTRGVRLSGGQIQRTAAARMFVRTPELMVFDDLSSALDVETEEILWERVFASRSEDAGGNRPTCLVVSHRHRVLQQADHIIVLKDGCVEDEGKLDVLLERCDEMKRLWRGI
ncbi:MAG: ABC transporter ATP-binding protein [Chloroflexota bacterium]